MLGDQEYRAQETADVIQREIANEPFGHIAALWLTVPYASPLTVAATIVATHAQAHELNRAQFKACAGSHPVISQSGRHPKAP